jgi:hypothetical protein
VEEAFCEAQREQLIEDFGDEDWSLRVIFCSLSSIYIRHLNLSICSSVIFSPCSNFDFCAYSAHLRYCLNYTLVY